MANEFYNRGATFNPDELADGDALEAEFDAVVRGFDTINTAIDTDRAGYPTQTFHVAPATEATHAPQKSQLDAHINDQGGVHGATSVNTPDKLVMRDAYGDIHTRKFIGALEGNADTATSAATKQKGDKSDSIATTAFVKESGFEFSNGGIGLVADSALTAAHANGWFEIQVAGILVTIPECESVPVGSTYTFRTSNACYGTIKGSGTETIIDGSGVAANTFALTTGETVTFVNNGSSWCSISSGFDHTSFASLKNSIGYQKLPTGLIMQWGNVGGVAGDGWLQTDHYITLPITFPNAALGLSTTNRSMGNAGAGIVKADISVTQLHYRIQNTQDLQDFMWIAIGY